MLSRLALKPGRYEVRVAVDAGPAERASVYTYVDVPNFAEQPLSLSGLVIGASPALPAAAADGFRDVLPIVPTSRRDFARTNRVSAFLRVYQRPNGEPPPVGITAQIHDLAGRILMKDAASLESRQFGTVRSADYRIALPVDRLNRGEYLLNIEATAGQSVAHRAVRFRVR